MKEASQVIRNIVFDNEALGKYTFEKVQSSWKNTFGSVGVDEGRCEIVLDEETGRKCLRVSYMKNKIGPKEGGAAWRMKLGKIYDELFFQFKVKFPIGFDFVLGGKLCGVGGGSLPVGGEKCDETGFTARTMWRGENGGKKGRIVQYVYYIDKDKNKKHGEDMDWKHKDMPVYFEPGKWHTLKTRVKMNHPQKKDGVISSWIDNKLVLNKRLRFRIDKKLGIDTFIFTTFFGGNTQEWAPKKEQYALFNDFVISTKDII